MKKKTLASLLSLSLIVGMLSGYEDGEVIIDSDGEIRIPRSDISKLTTIYFED